MKACIVFSATVALAATFAYAQDPCTFTPPGEAPPAATLICQAGTCCAAPGGANKGICCNAGERCPDLAVGETGCNGSKSDVPPEEEAEEEDSFWDGLFGGGSSRKSRKSSKSKKRKGGR